MYQGSPKDVALHLSRMGRKVPKGENSIEYLIDVIQEYDQSEHGVDALAEFALTGMKPPALSDEEMSMSTVVPSPVPPHRSGHRSEAVDGKGTPGKRLHLQTSAQNDGEFDHSVRSPWNNSRSWSASQSGIANTLRFTPSRMRNNPRTQNPTR